MARSRTSKFDASEAITNELIRIIERGVLPWRKPWTAGASTRPLRHNGEPYQGINNFMLTMRTMAHGYSSPYWMTFMQAKAQGGMVRKGEKSSVVVHYGTSSKTSATPEEGDDGDVRQGKVFAYRKSYRVFNACQIEGLPESFYPQPVHQPDHPQSEPIPHMQAFFDAIDIETVFTGREAYYMPAVDRVYMPEIGLFEDPRAFYGVWAHELSHATKGRHRLNRSYGDARFGNTAYAQEEIVAELSSCFLGQELGFTAHTLEMNAAYLENCLRVLRSDKTAIFSLASDACRACDWLIAASKAGAEAAVAQVA